MKWFHLQFAETIFFIRLSVVKCFQTNDFNFVAVPAPCLPVFSAPHTEYKRCPKGSTAAKSSSPSFSNPTRMENKSSLRSVAFAAVVFSTVAVTACIFTFPMVFHYVQTLQATVQVSTVLLILCMRIFTVTVYLDCTKLHCEMLYIL